MLTGRFGDTSGRPYFEGWLIFPRLEIEGDISFIFDMGADCSVLMPLDGRRIGVDYNQFSKSVETVGIGGSSINYAEPALVMFSGMDALYVYSIEIHISDLAPDIMDISSLLGRDIIDRWRVTYDKAQGILTAEVHSADSQIDLPLIRADPDAL